MKRRCRPYLVLGVAAVLGCGFFAACVKSPAVLSAAGRWLDVGRPPRPADAVVLLNGGYNTRPFVAAALVRGHWAPKILLNTVALHPAQEAGIAPPSHEIAQRVLEYCQVPADQVVLLDTTAESTFDEAHGVARYLVGHPERHILLVTDSPHTRRAEWVFRRVLSDSQVEISSVASPPEDFDMKIWWRNQAGVLFVVTEYFKLLFYALRYGWLGWEILLLAATIFLLRVGFCPRRKRDSRASVI